MALLSFLASVGLMAGLDAPVIVSIIAGILLPVMGFLATMVWRFHKRILELEKESQTREQVVYGGENNPLNLGLVKEIKSLKEDFEEYEKRQKELLEQKEKLFEKIQSIESKIEAHQNNQEDD